MLKTRLQQDIKNVFHNTRRFYWEKSKLDQHIGEILQSPEYNKLKRFEKEYLLGYICALREWILAETVFAYKIKGIYLNIESPEYREIPPDKVNRYYSDCGAFVWRKDNQKVFA